MSQSAANQSLVSKFPAIREFAGNFSEFEPDQGIRIPEQGIWRPPGIPTRSDFVGRARLAGAALAGGHDCIAASVHSAFDDVRLASQFESPPSTQSPSSTQAGRMAGV